MVWKESSEQDGEEKWKGNAGRSLEWHLSVHECKNVIMMGVASQNECDGSSLNSATNIVRDGQRIGKHGG